MKQKMTGIAALIMCSAIVSYGQSSPKPSVIVKGGLNLSNITINKNGGV